MVQVEAEVVDQLQLLVYTILQWEHMVDDDHENTLCQVTGKCKPYQHCQISEIPIAVMKMLLWKYMITVKDSK